jgi:hypothetical protein
MEKDFPSIRTKSMSLQSQMNVNQSPSSQTSTEDYFFEGPWEIHLSGLMRGTFSTGKIIFVNLSENQPMLLTSV